MHAEFPECNVVVRVPSWRIKVNLLCFQFLLVQVSLVLIQTKTNQHEPQDIIKFVQKTNINDFVKTHQQSYVSH